MRFDGKIVNGKLIWYNKWQLYAMIPYSLVIFREQVADLCIFNSLAYVEITPWKIYVN